MICLDMVGLVIVNEEVQACSYLQLHMTSVQHLITSLILDGSVRFAYRFVVLFFYS